MTCMIGTLMTTWYLLTESYKEVCSCKWRVVQATLRTRASQEGFDFLATFQLRIALKEFSTRILFTTLHWYIYFTMIFYFELKLNVRIVLSSVQESGGYGVRPAGSSARITEPVDESGQRCWDVKSQESLIGESHYLESSMLCTS